jgi:hypothetical protein
MIQRYTLLVLFLCLGYLPKVQAAGCSGAFKEVMIQIIPDNYPTETSWSLYDDVTNVRLDTGSAVGDTICVDSSHCLRFTIYDVYGDGICCTYGNGSYTLKLNGSTVTTGAHFGHSETTYFNCPQGHDCNNPFTAQVGSITTPIPDTWYLFTPDSTGMYDITTCGQGNTCDTRIYIYDHCAGLVTTNNNQGTTFYNDNGCSSLQSYISAALVKNNTYYIRIGQTDTSCRHHSINWQIIYNGPIKGCMDTASCNYNPLATVPDTNCVYPPNALCASPDLAIDQAQLISTMYLDSMTVGNGDCYVNEGCLAGYGQRRLVRFDTHIRNIGNQDYFIGAPDTVGNQFVWDPCHSHWHYVGYAEYLLLDNTGSQVQVGFKNGFCVLDLECGGGGIGKYSCSNMGITSGCGDVYAAGLACQWIDITDVDTGAYTLVVRVNWNRKPDKLGHYELNYHNNWAQVCLKIGTDSHGKKNYVQLPNCPTFVDCAGDTFGNARTDCSGTCNGSRVRGDLNVNLGRDTTDLRLYIAGMTADTLATTTCNDLNGDGRVSVTDAARLNGCLRSIAGTLSTLNNPQTAQHICEYPYNVYDPLDSVIFSIGNVDWQHHYIDISVYNPLCKVMGYELKIGGATLDSVKNLALGNYQPDIHHAASGHITELSNENEALYKQLAPLNFLRAYFSNMHDSAICIERVIDVVNDNYQQVLGLVLGNCAIYRTTGVAEVNANMELKLIPNPSTGLFDLYMNGQSLYGASAHVYDQIGRLVYSREFNDSYSNKMQFDLSEQPTGLYTVELNLHGTIQTKRVMLLRNK